MRNVSKQALTMQDVASALQVSLMTVRRMVKNGQIKGTRLGRLWRCTEEDVKEAMEKRNIVTRRQAP